MDTYFDGAWRMDWGFGNPNTTAVLIACLMIAVWSIARIGKWGFWIALAISTGLACCLVETYSRGGMVAWLFGLVVLSVWAPRPRPRTKWIGVTIALWVLGAFVLFARAQARYGQGLFSDDQSIGNRLIIWRRVPEMIAAAPWGWGWGNAGDAYTQWFQPASQSVNYLNLINSHLNFMVEAGWIGSVIYLFAWWIVILLCWPSEKCGISSVPLAIWTAFGVGACFSHVESSPWLWVIPLGALLTGLNQRMWSVQWPNARALIAGGCASVLVVALLILAGATNAAWAVHRERGITTIGIGKDSIVIFVDRKVMGSLYGHTFRRFLAKNPALARQHQFVFVESEDGPPGVMAGQLVVSGRFVEDPALFAKVGFDTKIVLVNPSGFFDRAQIGRDWASRTTVYFGEYAEAPARSAWSGLPGVKAVQIEGAADFVPSWPVAIWSTAKS